MSTMNTANAMLWSLRRGNVTHVLAATEIEDFAAVELVDIVPALDPSVKLILCGSTNPDLTHATKQTNVELVSSVHDLVERLQQLRLAPTPEPAVRKPPTRPMWSGRRTASATTVLGLPQMTAIDGVLRELIARTQAQAVVLSDLTGMTIAQVGEVPADAAPLYAPLLGTLFTASVEFGHAVGETHAQRLYAHGGVRHQVYALACGERWILSAVRESAIDGSVQQPLLMVMQQAVRDLLMSVEL